MSMHKAGLVTIFAALWACTPVDPNPGSGGGPNVEPPENPTYFQHVKPIVNAKCVGCHKAGGIAPMSFENSATIGGWAPQMRHAVVNRHMPPWLASPDCNEYLFDRSLSDAQIETISRWAQAGAPLAIRRAKARRCPSKAAPCPASIYGSTCPRPIRRRYGPTIIAASCWNGPKRASASSPASA